MAIRELLKRYPKQFVTKMKIWTPKRSTIESSGPHDEMVGMLLVQLSVRDEARNEQERTAMQHLLDVFRQEGLTDG